MGLSLRIVYGLNIFVANKVAKKAVEDPRVVFLRALSQQMSCSAHLGSGALEDIVSSIKDLSICRDEQACISTNIALYGGEFYSSDDTILPSYFVRNVDESLWVAKTENGTSVIDYLYRCDALALYAGSHTESQAKMQILLGASFIDNENWMQKLSELYSLVILSGYDGWHFNVFSKEPSNFDLLSNALDDTIKYVEASDWYSQNAPELQWDQEEDSCLKLP